MIDTHPYHIVVVAGQECPTASGIHRGIGGGLMKGMSVRHGKHRHSKDEKEGMAETMDSQGFRELAVPMEEGGEGTSSGSRTPAVASDVEYTDDGASFRTTTPVMPNSAAATPGGGSVPPPQPHMHKHHNKEPRDKGWSQMLDEWFCGPAVTDAAVPTSPTTREAVKPILPSLNLTLPTSMMVARSASAPVSAAVSTVSTPMAIPVPQPNYPAHPMPLLSRSHSTASSTSSASSAASSDAGTPQIDFSDMQKSFSLPVPPQPSSLERPEIVEPNPEPRVAESRAGCYSHVLKERLMGMYLTVYVYRGCEHLVQGVDKDYVTAGLARGRVGNKGGVGIALKLAGRSFLFVNSHLAAHKHRIAARLDNIAKIKSEIHLNDFLPKDDPRKAAEDITDRFDTVFWMGDLNFRLEMSRLHAEWLVEQKNYKELLTWDQLRAVMRDPDNNPFPGFVEGPIDFAPTFKYDVWRSFKHIQKERRKSLHRHRSGTQSSVRTETGAKALGTSLAESGLTGLAETHEEGEERSSGEENRTSLDRPGLRSTPSMKSTRSIRSVRSVRNDDEEEDEEDEAPKIDASAYGSRHKALEVAIKAKTKQLLSRVQLGGLLGSSPGSRNTKRRDSVYSLSRDDSARSRRESITSLRSVVDSRGAWQPASASDEQHGDNFAISTSPPPAVPASATTNPPASPSRPRHLRTTSMKSFIALKRTVSGRSSREDEDDEGEEEFALDQREGVYDSSKKQRVPSWCDRVLWKTAVVEELDTVDEEDTSAPHRSPRRLSRILARLSPTMETRMLPTRDRLDRELPPIPGSPNMTLVTSPDATPRPNLVSLTSGNTSSQSIARRRQSHPPRAMSTGGLRGEPSAPEVNAAPIMARQVSQAEHRQRSGSDVAGVRATSSSAADHRPGISLSHTQPVRRHSTLEVGDSPPRRANGVPIGKRSMTLDPEAVDHGSRLSMRSLRASMGVNNAAVADNSFTRFFRELPTMLHVRPASVAVTDDEAEVVLEKEQKPKHKQGEIVCLHYGTLDDGG